MKTKAANTKQNKWALKNKKKKKQHKPTNRQNKLHIKFDPEDRRKYLTGFQKRKKERQQRAQKEMEESLKAEKNRIRKDRVKIMQRMLYRNEDEVPGSDEEEEGPATVASCGSATVEIRGLDLASAFHIGSNQMEAGKKQAKEEKQSDEEEEEDVSQERLEELGILTQKDLYRSLKKSSLQVLKKNPLMKLKQKRDAKKQKKIQMRDKKERLKHKAKKMRHRRPPPQS